MSELDYSEGFPVSIKGMLVLRGGCWSICRSRHTNRAKIKHGVGYSSNKVNTKGLNTIGEITKKNMVKPTLKIV